MGDKDAVRSRAAGMPLLLEVRGEGSQAIAESEELGRLLDLLLHDPAILARLEGDVAGLRALLPIAASEPDAPEWVRAAELLEDAQACPGERLLTNSIGWAATWWRAEELAAAACALDAGIAAGTRVPASISQAAVRRGCTAVATAVARLPAARQARLL